MTDLLERHGPGTGIRVDEFAVYESSGLWNAPVSAWKNAVDQCQRAKVHSVPVSLGMHTEATQDQVLAAFRHRPGHWGHVRMDKGSMEIVNTFDRDLWHIHRAHAILLSSIPIRTKSGHLQPATYMLEVIGTFLPTGRRVYAQGLHWPLRNTPPRAKAWSECKDGVQHRWEHITARDPDAIVAHLADFNEDVRREIERRRMLELASGVPGFHQSWNLRDLPDRGTHGIDLIDNVVTNAPIRKGGAIPLHRIQLLDHGPLGVLLGAPAHHRAGRELADLVPPPVVEPDTEHEPLAIAA